MKNIFKKIFYSKDINKLEENVEIGYKVLRMREIIEKMEQESNEIVSKVPACKECKWYTIQDGEFGKYGNCIRPNGNRKVIEDFENGLLTSKKETIDYPCFSERYNTGLRYSNADSCDIHCGPTAYFFKPKEQ